MADGLWAGAVTASAVSVAADGGTPRDAPAPFTFPVILYVEGGTAQLVDEAVILRAVESETGTRSTVLPKLYLDMAALASDLAAMGADSLSDVAARRISSAAYSLAAPVPALGTPASGATLSLTLALEPTAPTHPFRHQYHPDHDNLSEDYTPLPPDGPQEVPAIRRDVAFTFDRLEPALATGRFREVIHGLHAAPLTVAGRFEVDRMSALTVQP